ncbi:hypothetical protein PBT90_05340 [Algoriphagus halophytocola]|uniref:Uncharacterized protein n=1 Tax=Algoriphagus halophytocola TaxID=2991499 RepID=A0ABY6MKN2_9BACT|nr:MULTISPECIES: hypothetical protein [unclassified Algoriphagus]UZD22841.1 hypothetical protein OM944_19600 [Algoriphagus sp. TR-M5]WBL44108.1 hypothetical protein PBT90_05340 [Algoriphagus sp. TR-M9]
MSRFRGGEKQKDQNQSEFFGRMPFTIPYTGIGNGEGDWEHFGQRTTLFNTRLTTDKGSLTISVVNHCTLYAIPCRFDP